MSGNFSKDIVTTRMIILAVMLTLLAGCGQSINSGDEDSAPVSGDSSESEWEPGEGELPNQIGERSDLDDSKTDRISEGLFIDSIKLAEITGYHAPTGKWFMHEGEGLLGYGLTGGTQKSGNTFFVSLIGHEEDGEVIDRDVRIQLTLLTDAYQKEEVIVEETLHVDTVWDNDEIYSGVLPENENVSYLLSAEILNEEGKVEDTRISYIYVPAPEMNVMMSLDKQVYELTDTEATLVIKNYGPTILMLTMHYSVEKKVDGTWRNVPLDLAFIEIAIDLGEFQEHKQIVDISGFDEGEYRVIKKVRAQDLSANIAAAFRIE